MGERRKRKSLWDMEGETKSSANISEYDSWRGREKYSTYDSGLKNEFSTTETNDALNPRDRAGWSSWESLDDITAGKVGDRINKGRLDASDGKVGREASYYRTVSPGLDGPERGHSYVPDNDGSRAGRHLGRGRSRSRSRSRVRGRSRSRSRGGGRHRVRSRSRSGSGGRARGRTRSRSPIHDHRREYYGWSDRRNGSDKSPPPCRDFVVGRCRRGSQCRFPHPDDMTRREGDYLDDDRAESWRNRPEHGRTSQHVNDRGPGFDSRDNVSDSYFRDNEHLRNRGRGSAPCRDFVKGSCRWGESCRFSHHIASIDNYDRDARNTFFDVEHEHPPEKHRKPACKFFAAGKCHRDNCRFSHDTSNLYDLEGRRVEDTGNGSLGDRNRGWDALPMANPTMKPSDWSENVIADSTYGGGTGTGRGDDRWSHNFPNESRAWGSEEGRSNPSNRDEQISSRWDGGGYSGRMDAIEDQGEMSSEQIQNQDAFSTYNHGKNETQVVVGRDLTPMTLQQNASEHLDQNRRFVEDDVPKPPGSAAFHEIKDTRDTTKHSFLLSGQTLNQSAASAFSGHSLFPSGTDRGQQKQCPDQSNVSNSDSYSSQQPGSFLNFQTIMQSQQKIVEEPEKVEFKTPPVVPNTIPSEHSAQTANSITGGEVALGTKSNLFLNCGFVNGNQPPQTYTGAVTSDPSGMLPSYSGNASLLPLGNTNTTQSIEASRPLDILDALGNGTEEPGNHIGVHGTLSRCTESNNNQIIAQESAPSSAVDPEFHSSEVQHNESLDGKQLETISNSELKEVNNTVAEKGKEEVGHSKVEEGRVNKDEKAMRLFKNSLIEFVKDILKPTWKEGRVSREAHKTILKKVVDKVTGSLQGDHIPKTQDKVELYLAHSRPKITKLVQAYVERNVKPDS